ncbi:MAG: PrsW family intramembrane metalloprotease [Cytophagaceae bacterium]|jgi:RsiW-degrading membrane proteinase PrsW (M82 family)/predicted negative regulator of RcsB-dependent stress response|nr:PrsW family intramembrane metalloprotease [Cytophagaceae bacterium]
MKKNIFFCIALLGIVWLLSGFLLQEPWNDTEPDYIPANFEKIEEFGLRKDTFDVGLHFRNFLAHCKKPYYQNLSTGLSYRDDDAFEKYYQVYCEDSRQEISDLGYLMRTYLLLFNKKDDLAWIEFKKIQNRTLAYYDGAAAVLQSSSAEGLSNVELLEKEIKKHPENQIAIKRLANLYYDTNDYEGLAHLYHESRKEDLKPYLDIIYFYTGEISQYLVEISKKCWHFQWTYVMIAFFSVLLWLGYLYLSSRNEKFPWIPMLSAFLIGLLCIPLVYILHHSLEILFHVKRSSIGSQFLYCYLNISLVEEITKLIPVAMVYLLFKNSLRTPLSWILVGCSAALSFAFLENNLYFEYYQQDVIYRRTFLCIPSHMFFTCLSLYGLFSVSYPNQAYSWKNGIVYFFLGVLAHGTYDALLMVPGLNKLWIFSIFLAYFFAFGLHRILNDAINISPAFPGKVSYLNESLQRYFMLGFCGLWCIEILLNSLRWGHSTSSDIAIKSSSVFFLLLLFWKGGITNFQVVKNLRTPILSIPDRFKFQFLIGKKLQLDIVQQGQLIGKINGCQSHAQVKVSTSGNFIVLDPIPEFPTFKHFLLQPITEYRKAKERYVGAALYATTSDVAPEEGELEKKDLAKLGSAQVRIEGELYSYTDWAKYVGTGTTLLFLFVGLFGFFVYMNFRSAVLGYEWAFPYLKEKNLSIAGQNLEYSIGRRENYANARFEEIKIYYYLQSYPLVLERIELITPTTQQMKRGLLYMKAASLYRTGNILASQKVFESLLQEDVTKVSDSVHYYLAAIQVRTHLCNQALASLNQFEVHRSLPSIGKVVLQTECAIQSGDCNKAIALLEHLEFRSFAKDGKFYHRMGNCYLQQGDTAKACLQWQKGIEKKYAPSFEEHGRWCTSNYE